MRRTCHCACWTRPGLPATFWQEGATVGWEIPAGDLITRPGKRALLLGSEAIARNYFDRMKESQDRMHPLSGRHDLVLR